MITFIFLITSCTNLNGKRVLPDLTGKSRSQIEVIMKEKDIDYVFKFSDQIIESSLDLDMFVSYNGNYKAGDEIDADYQVYVYTTVLPITYKIHDRLTIDFDYKGKSFINDGDTATFRDIITNEIFRLRFLGIDTPESTIDKDPWGKAASEYTKKKLSSANTIVLEAEGARTENYGRYLGFVWVDGVLLNLEIVEQAYSNSTLSKGKYYEYFSLASENAQKTGRRFYGETDPNYDYVRKEFK